MCCASPQQTGEIREAMVYTVHKQISDKSREDTTFGTMVVQTVERGKDGAILGCCAALLWFTKLSKSYS